MMMLREEGGREGGQGKGAARVCAGRGMGALVGAVSREGGRVSVGEWGEIP